MPVFLDGGVRRGTDVFKALALGASGIFVSRNVEFIKDDSLHDFCFKDFILHLQLHHVL